MRKIAIGVLRTGLTLVLGVVLCVFFFERRLIFHPERNVVAKPWAYEEVHFQALDETRLHAWFIPYEGSRRVFIISHGNAGNIGYRVDYYEFVRREFKENIFAYDYRGYGKSEGTPSEEGTYSDLRGAIRAVRSRGIEPRQIYLIGQSLGTAVTLGVAGQEQPGGIILEAPFTSVREIAAHHAFSIPIGYLFRSRYDSLARVAELDVPIVIVHARRDPVIPYELGERLYSAIPSPKRFYPVDGEIHEGAMMALGIQDLASLRNFLENRGQ